MTCGDGIITRTRTCDNPAPSDGGDDCFGSSNETVQCNVDPCPGKISLGVNKFLKFVNSF